MIVMPRRIASHIAIADFPDAVGPQMTGIVAGSATPGSAPAKAPLELIPRQVDDGGAAVYVVRGQDALTQRHEQGPHLLRRERVARLDRGLACDGRRKMLTSRARARDPIAGERRERVTQAALGVEARMRRGNGVNDHGLAAELAELVTQRLQQIPMRIERVGLGTGELQREREQQTLRRAGTAFQGVHETLVQHALVRGVLIDEDDTGLRLEHEIRAAELEQRRMPLSTARSTVQRSRKRTSAFAGCTLMSTVSAGTTMSRKSVGRRPDGSVDR